MDARETLLSLFVAEGGKRLLFGHAERAAIFVSWCERQARACRATAELVDRARRESVAALLTDGWHSCLTLRPDGRLTMAWQRGEAFAGPAPDPSRLN